MTEKKIRMHTGKRLGLGTFNSMLSDSKVITFTVMFVEFIFDYYILVLLQFSELQEKTRKLAFHG